MASRDERDTDGRVVVALAVEIIERRANERCPRCGFDSLECATAVMTMDGQIIGGPAIYQRCARGCDDDDIIAEGHAG
jgi:hypothetical protein